MARKCRKLLAIALIGVFLLCTSKTPYALARVILQTNETENNADTYILDADDSSSDYIKLQFGSTLDSYLRYDIASDEFDINKDFNFNQQEAKNIVIHQDTSFPGSPVEGQLFYRTDANNLYFYTGTGWQVTGGGGGGSDAATLDGLDSTDFLRSNADDNYTNNATLTFDSGTTIRADSATVYLDDTVSDTFRIDSNDDTADYVQLSFGNTLSKYIRYDTGVGEFDINASLDFQDNYIRNVRLDNLSVAPTCNSSYLGKKYFNTIDEVSYICTSAGWTQETNDTATGTGQKIYFVELTGGVRNSMATGTVAGGNSPVLRADADGNSRVRWSFSVPGDWVTGTDIVIEVYWSPSNTDTGNVRWEFDYATKAEGEVIASGDFSEIPYTQAAPGTTLQITSTSNQITIPNANIAVDDMINFQINRNGGDAADTFTGDVNIHMVAIRYIGRE
jgi:hypothetical protein